MSEMSRSLDYNGQPEPADLLFDSVADWKVGSLTAEDLIGCVESKLGRPLVGMQRADLLSLAEQELNYDREQFGNEEQNGSDD